MIKTKVVVCAVLTANRNSPESFVFEFVSDIYAQLNLLSNVEGQVILSVETDGRDGWIVFKDLQSKYSNFLVNGHLATATKNASLYTEAFQLALDAGVDLVVEIDASGAHDPRVLANFLEEAVNKLQAQPKFMVCVMSTRMSAGGADMFPFGRVFVSKAGTFFAHLLLMLGRQGRSLTDFTSGYAAYSSTLLLKMQELLPFEEWVSIKKGPLHLFQTEARAMVCWIASYATVEIFEKPIIYGANLGRKPSSFTFVYLLKALIGGILLIFEGVSLKLKLAKSK